MGLSIRRLIYEQVVGDAQIAGMLAVYNGAPAFFYQKSPSDSRKGWGEFRYPRVDFNIDMRHDPERKTAGTLSVNIWVTAECAVAGELDPDREIEKRLMELISGAFYTGPDRVSVCAKWERSDEFVYEGSAQHDTHPEVYGLTVVFELMEFPEQITASPDPVQGLNEWTKRYFGPVAVIAYEDMPPIWKPSDSHPAVYWRFEGVSGPQSQSYSVAWHTGVFAAHVIAGSVPGRNKWIKAMAERIQAEGEVVLPDSSPMFIHRASVRHGSDPLREGQLELTGRYGVLSQAWKETAQAVSMRVNNRNKEGL